MNLPGFSVSRPIFASMVWAMVIALGLVSFTRLRIDLLPEVELPTCTIRTEYEGAAPEVVERLVTQIVEEIVATVPGVQEIESQSLAQGGNCFVGGVDAKHDLRCIPRHDFHREEHEERCNREGGNGPRGLADEEIRHAKTRLGQGAHAHNCYITCCCHRCHGRRTVVGPLQGMHGRIFPIL